MAFGLHTGSTLLVFDSHGLLDTIECEEGLLQGNGVSSLAFNMSVQPLFVRALEGLDGVEAVAVHDDFTLVGEPVAVFKAYDRLKHLLGANGLYLTVPKCRVLTQLAPTAHVLRMAAARNLKVVTGSMELLGARVGTLADDATQAKFRALLDTHQVMFAALSSPHMPMQCSLLLLRMCRMNYVARVLPPAITEPWMVAFDNMVFTCLANIIGIHISVQTVAYQQIIFRPFVLVVLDFVPMCASLLPPTSRRSLPPSHPSLSRRVNAHNSTRT